MEYVTDELISMVQKWQRETFPEPSMAGATNHLDKELAEVYEELADCAIIAMQKAQLEPGDSGRVYLGSFLYTLGFCCTLLGGSLQEAIEKKMVKNMSRVWPRKPDADGVYHHESQ